MLQVLKSLRDFLDAEQLKHLPGNLQVRSCILLTQSVGGGGEPLRQVLQIFDREGVYIGTIEEPAWLPRPGRE